MTTRYYCAIDLKSFYASVECRDRGLDPLTTNLVVADVSRTEKTICLAVSPTLKSYGIGGRARLFEVNQRLREVNYERQWNAPYHRLTGKSSHNPDLIAHPDWAVDYIAATPRMARYIEVSTKIYSIYLKYIAPEDIHVYSIDEVFFDCTDYLQSYKMTPHELVMKMIQDVLRETGITATGGIGTNLFLAKVAMDVVAKHIPADKDGVRIAELDEMKFREQLWDYRPITKFWRIGHGIAQKLARYGMDTMGKVARCSVENEELLYKLFGVNAELLIDHAWGWEPCTMAAIKAYKPEHSSVSSGQVLHCAYSYDKGLVVAKEMADALALDLFSKHLVTDQLGLYVGYDKDSEDPYSEKKSDWYGQYVPKPAHGSVRLKLTTNSNNMFMEAIAELYQKIVDPTLLVRRLNISAVNVISEDRAGELQRRHTEELDLFTDYEAKAKADEAVRQKLEKERKLQEATLKIKEKFGKNALLRGLNFSDGATMRDRNNQIGGHKA